MTHAIENWDNWTLTIIYGRLLWGINDRTLTINDSYFWGIKIIEPTNKFAIQRWIGDTHLSTKAYQRHMMLKMKYLVRISTKKMRTKNSGTILSLFCEESLAAYTSGWWYSYPSEKSWSSSVGMMTFHSQIMESHSKFHGSSHHQPVYQYINNSPNISFR
jgi:hypothetical protein